MVSLGNQARLLAAQAFNKRVLEEKAAKKRAEIEAERLRDVNRTARREAEKLKLAKNARDRQLIQDSINQTLASKAEKARQARINAEAKRKTANVFTRVAKGADIGVLTGFEAKKDSRGRTVGISTRESATRKNTRALLLREIQQQRIKASRETDLERFLKNERAINAGQVSSAELNRQIAQRKARGLSKTPAQKRASQGFRDSQFSSALTARSKTKPRGLTATFGGLVSERARAEGLGSSPFADPLFAGGGRTQKSIIARGGTFGARAGGQSISSQLSFISQAKSRSTSARIGFASSLLAGLGSGGIFSGGASQQTLLGFVKQKTIATPKTFEQELRAGVGFFTTVQAPVTKPTLTKAQRGRLVAQRKAEDKAIADESRATIQATKAKTKATQRARGDDLSRISANLLTFNTQRGRAIESQNLLRSPRFSTFGFDSGVTVQRQQAQAPTSLSLIPNVPAFGGQGLPSGVTSKQVGGVERFFKNGKQIKGRELIAIKQNLNAGFGLGSGTGTFSIVDGVARSGESNIFDPRLAQAQLTQRQTEALRKSKGTKSGKTDDRDFGIETLGFGFDEGIVAREAGLTQATGQPSRTDVNIFAVPRAISADIREDLSLVDQAQVGGQGNIFDFSFTEDLSLSGSATKKKKKGTTPQTTRRSPTTSSSFLQSLISFGATTPSPTPKPTTPTPKTPKATTQAQQGVPLNAFGTPSIDLTFGAGAPVGKAIRGVAGGVADFIAIARGGDFTNISQGARVGTVSQSALDREIASNLGIGRGGFFGLFGS